MRNIGELLNSPFVLWVLSTCVIGGGISLYEKFTHERDMRDQLISEAVELENEIEGRLLQYSHYFDSIVIGSNSVNAVGDKFIDCVTKESLAKSIVVFSSPPNERTDRKVGDCEFRLTTVHDKYKELHLSSILLRRIYIEERLYPPSIGKDEDGVDYIKRDDMEANTRIYHLRDALQAALTPEEVFLTPIEIEECSFESNRIRVKGAPREKEEIECSRHQNSLTPANYSKKFNERFFNIPRPIDIANEGLEI